MANHLDYRLIFWLVLASIVIPIYILACALSVIKAYIDRKAMKARIEARRLLQPLPPGPIDIIASEVRANRWHKRKSTIAVSKLHTLLNTANNAAEDTTGVDGCSCGDEAGGAKAEAEAEAAAAVAGVDCCGDDEVRMKAENGNDGDDDRDGSEITLRKSLRLNRETGAKD